MSLKYQFQLLEHLICSVAFKTSLGPWFLSRKAWRTELSSSH
jgi:hypothetical protein